jgi:CelD/BcsL family acetyltransferase involved in cellulose biosynthesis
VIVQIYHGPTVFDQLSREWNLLAGHCMTDTPFQQLAYQRAWWRHLGPGNLYTITVRDEKSHLVAIAPFYLLDGVLYFNGCTEESDYLDLITPAAMAHDAWQAVFNCLAGDDFPDWQALDLCNIPAGSPSRAILSRLAESRGYGFTTEIHEVCPVIALPSTFEAYLGQLDGKQRHEIRRKLRRAEGAGLTVTTIRQDDDLEQAVNLFLELLQKSTNDKKGWLNDGRRALFHDVAAAALADGTLQLMFVTYDGRQAATLFNFAFKQRVWVYNSGLDPEAFGWLSPGVILTTRAIEQAIAQGYDCFDFLRGNETYKYRFGARDTTIHRVQISKAG